MLLFKQKNKNLVKAVEKGIHTLPDSHDKHYYETSNKNSVFSFLSFKRSTQTQHEVPQ